MSEYKKTIIDLGTGDGKFVYKNALKNRKHFYIGIDPNEKQLNTFKGKINRKKLENIQLVLGSLERLPDNLHHDADELYIILPWGSLLMNIVKPQKEVIKNLASLIKRNGVLTIVLGYAEMLEPSEISRLEIPELSEKYINEQVAPKFNDYGKLKLENVRQLSKKELRKIESTWSKKLAFGKERPIFWVEFVKN